MNEFGFIKWVFWYWWREFVIFNESNIIGFDDGGGGGVVVAMVVVVVVVWSNWLIVTI